MFVVMDLVRRIDPHQRLEGFFASFAARADIQEHAGLESFPDSRYVEGFKTGKAQACGRFAFSELQGKHTHADEVTAVNALEAFREYRLYTEQSRPLGSPIAGRAGAIFFACDDQERYA